MKKRCTHCGKLVLLTGFYNNSTAKDGLQSWCKVCQDTYVWPGRADGRMAEYTARWRSGIGQKKRLLNNAKQRAIKGGLPFSITEADIDIPEFCPVLGFKLTTGKGSVDPSSTSIDKIDPKRGYVPGNVQVMSYMANRMKSNATPTELLMFADWVYKTYGGGSDH